jgi:microcystin-dependent protein
VAGRLCGVFAYVSPTSSNLGLMAVQALSPAGGGLPHNNMQPYLTLSFCIALQGIFPQRP